MSDTAPPIAARIPVGADATRPSIARVYDYSLGGKDNYNVDREAFRRILKVAAGQRDVSRANRQWLVRVVRWIAEHGRIEQFLDLGAGLPTDYPLHQAAQECGRGDRTFVYVDNDPLCNAHGHALLERDDLVHYAASNLADPDATMKAAAQYIYGDKPVAVILGAVLHDFSDADDPAAITARYIELLPRGSYVAISHYCNPGDRDPELSALARELERAHVENLGSGWYRSVQQIRGLFHDLEMVDPGLVQPDQWWPLGPPSREPSPEERLMIAGVGYKPNPVRALPAL